MSNWTSEQDKQGNINYILRLNNFLYKIFPTLEYDKIKYCLMVDSTILGKYDSINDAKNSVIKHKKPPKVGDIIQRAWGTYRIIEVGKDHLIKELKFNPGKSTSYQCHQFRSEHWTIVQGDGIFKTEQTLNNIFNESYETFGKRYLYQLPSISKYSLTLPKTMGDSFFIPNKQKHQFTAGPNGCTAIEIWTGLLDEEDIERF